MQQAKGRELIPLFDEFARGNGMVSEKSNPIAPSYMLMSGGIESVVISLRLGMGKFGVELALFRYDQSRNRELVAKFDAFVTGELAPRYEVKKCTDVPGYGLPEIWQTLGMSM